MTQKQKNFDTATTELKDVRTKIASAQSDIEAADSKVKEAREVLKLAESEFHEARVVYEDLKQYEGLALKKTRKALDALFPGVSHHSTNIHVDAGQLCDAFQVPRSIFEGIRGRSF